MPVFRATTPQLHYSDDCHITFTYPEGQHSIQFSKITLPLSDTVIQLGEEVSSLQSSGHPVQANAACWREFYIFSINVYLLSTLSLTGPAFDCLQGATLGQRHLPLLPSSILFRIPSLFHLLPSETPAWFPWKTVHLNPGSTPAF